MALQSNVADTASELGALIALTYYQKVKMGWEGQKRGKGGVKLKDSLV